MTSVLANSGLRTSSDFFILLPRVCFMLLPCRRQIIHYTQFFSYTDRSIDVQCMAIVSTEYS